jgi:hypothetical protein
MLLLSDKLNIDHIKNLDEFLIPSDELFDLAKHTDQ